MGHGVSRPLRGLIPALAGTTTWHAAPSSSTRAHPRAGGDDLTVPDEMVEDYGSSPRWRGRPRFWTSRSSKKGLIPALAGTTPCRRTPSAWSWAHPRAGGDDVFEDGSRVVSEGSSPRWRGRPTCAPLNGGLIGLIPALAGTTPHADGCGQGEEAHPRAGGDDAPVPEAIRPVRGSSPRWRGRRHPRSPAKRRRRLIPALAGTTHLVKRGRLLGRAHPRAGGDDIMTSPSLLRITGSSPRWRGRQHRRCLSRDDMGLIPALAGTTSTLCKRCR